MKVIVMGSGVVGVTTAYCLLKDGHEVTVVERHDGAADETSFANAGLVAPGHAYTWASPKAPRILLKSLWRNDQALRFRLRLDPALWAWSLKFLGNCRSDRVAVNTARKVRLSLYSQDMLHQVVEDTGVAFDGAKGGLLYLYRSPAAFDAGVAKMRILTDNGLPLEVVDRDRAAAIDPALSATKDRIVGGIYAPSDESGDARLFTRNLADWCAERGVRFLYGTTIRGVETAAGEVTGLVTDKGTLTADAYVLAMGCQSAALAKPLGLSLPIYPIKGYSVTVPVAGRNNTPRIGGVDEENLVAYAPMGDRLRITATADFAGYDKRHSPADFQAMLAAARDLFPDAADYSRPSYWAGLRPMTPEGTPIFGRGRQRNLFLNTGHGHMGWTMSCGSARITADLIAGRTPAIPLDGMQAVH
ncbi:D-amino acid dehydrogenase [Azospirillum sp. TSA6c]|uniref:D-amino acid dehydrogenase n=1 Tax=unclassified Azospirillum TaxID=2630922 RepID=UPI000D613CA5|nr:D-amino acid dehydrogenase [Azospirillum sp. TSA6c]PWC54068.1 amino acid dehydrogenase [Azospirillum sp. TSA6c]